MRAGWNVKLISLVSADIVRDGGSYSAFSKMIAVLTLIGYSGRKCRAQRTYIAAGRSRILAAQLLLDSNNYRFDDLQGYNEVRKRA